MNKDIYAIAFRLREFRYRLVRHEILYESGIGDDNTLETIDFYKREIEDMEAELLVHELIIQTAIRFFIIPFSRHNRNVLRNIVKNEKVLFVKWRFSFKRLQLEWYGEYINKTGKCYF